MLTCGWGGWGGGTSSRTSSRTSCRLCAIYAPLRTGLGAGDWRGRRWQW